MSHCILLLNAMVWMVFLQTTDAKWLERNYYPKSVVAFVGAEGSMPHHCSSASNSSGEKLFATRYDATLASTSLREGTIGGPVVQSSSPNSSTTFDSACVANPVVLPPNSNNEKWQMYYYGNPGHWANGIKDFLPCGYVGLAESTDGIHWEKIGGNEDYGSVLAPTGEEDDFDGLHVGVGDVIRIGTGDEEELHMYYFGGSFETVILEGSDIPPCKGLRMRIGKARSTDGGRSWQRLGQVLDYNPSEGLFASWPRIILPDRSRKPWRMVYHSFTGREWAAYEAISRDEGETWERGERNMALGPGDPNGWDGTGIGTRAVIRTKDGELIMVYEAVAGQGGPMAGRHRFGLARWEETDDVGGGVWMKDTAITGIPGGPILDGGVGPMDPWTSRVIGTPYLVAADDGSIKLYFCSKKDNDTPMSIGLVESASGDFSPSSWKAISP